MLLGARTVISYENMMPLKKYNGEQWIQGMIAVTDTMVHLRQTNRYRWEAVMKKALQKDGSLMNAGIIIGALKQMDREWEASRLEFFANSQLDDVMLDVDDIK